MDGHQRDNISAAGSHGDHGYDGAGESNEARTWDFLATSSPWWQGGSLGLFPGAAQPTAGSTSFNESRLAFDSLDLNADDGWQQMHHYAGFLRSDNDVPHASPSGARALSQRGAQPRVERGHRRRMR
jgi:hypothetical protein